MAWNDKIQPNKIIPKKKWKFLTTVEKRLYSLLKSNFIWQVLTKFLDLFYKRSSLLKQNNRFTRVVQNCVSLFFPQINPQSNGMREFYVGQLISSTFIWLELRPQINSSENLKNAFLHPRTVKLRQTLFLTKKCWIKNLQ